MNVLKITPLRQMASGAKFCALISDGSRSQTGFGVTEDDAVADAESRLLKGKSTSTKRRKK